MAIYFLLPFVLIGAAAAAGFGTSWLMTGMRAGPRHSDERLQLAVGLAVAIPVVAAATILIPRSGEFQNLYGDFLQELWVWAAGAYVIGCIFGWLYCVQAE